jgi:fructose-1,6-bisphosphatase/inositol monophosphatase family enzyme
MEDIFDVFLRSIRLFKNPNNNIVEFKGNIRDVVNSIDLDISNLFLDFYEKKFEKEVLSFICEENSIGNDLNNCLLVDPLDGSYNFAIGLKEFCSMACLIKNGKIIESGIYVPSENYILCINHISGESKMSNNKESIRNIDFPKPICYAYSPIKDACKNRDLVLNQIDKIGCGFVRYGSAGYGLYQCLSGRLDGFIGQGVRIWDVVPLFKLLVEKNFYVFYKINNNSLDVIVHNKNEVIKNFISLDAFSNLIKFNEEIIWQV